MLKGGPPPPDEHTDYKRQEAYDMDKKPGIAQKSQRISGPVPIFVFSRIINRLGNAQ